MQPQQEVAPAPPRNALRNIALYGGSALLVSGSNFLTVPLLVALLGADGFSVWSLLEPLLLIFLPVAGLGINFGLMNAGRNSAADAHSAAETLVLSHVALAALVGCSIGVASAATGTPVPLAMLLSLVVATEGSIVFFVALFRAQDRPLSFAAMEGGRTFLTLLIVGAAVLFAYEHFDISSYLLLRATTAFVALAAAIILVGTKLRPSWTSTLDAIKYGAPIVTGSLIVAGLSSLDRYALSYTGHAASLASYTAHTKLAQTLSIATGPFFMWYAPKAIQQLHHGNAGHPFLISATSFAFLFSIMAGGSLLILSPSIWRVLFPTLAFDLHIFASMIFGMCAFSLAPTLGIGCLQQGKTFLAPTLTFGALIVALTAAVAGGHLFGELGVSAGRSIGFIAYAALFLAATMLGPKVRYPAARYVALYVAAFFVAFWLALFTGSHGILASVLVASGYCLLIVCAGAFTLSRSLLIDETA